MTSRILGMGLLAAISAVCAVAQPLDDMFMAGNTTGTISHRLYKGFWSGPTWVVTSLGTPGLDADLIAVSGDVRTEHARYDLNLGFQGSFGTVVRDDYGLDGTTDGLFNYGARKNGVGNHDREIWQYDRNWRNPSMYLDLAPILAIGESLVGITFDRTTDTFWLVARDLWAPSNRLVQVNRNGALLGTVPLGFQAQAIGIESSGVLWIEKEDSLQQTLTFVSYAPQFGQFTGELDPNDWQLGRQIQALEFNIDPVPEPTTLCALTGTLIGFAIRRRRSTGTSR